MLKGSRIWELELGENCCILIPFRERILKLQLGNLLSKEKNIKHKSVDTGEASSNSSIGIPGAVTREVRRK
jgi:hypothetical protein